MFVVPFSSYKGPLHQEPLRLSLCSSMKRWEHPDFELDLKALYDLVEPRRALMGKRPALTTATEIQQRVAEGMSAVYKLQHALTEIQRDLLASSYIDQLRRELSNPWNYSSEMYVELRWQLAREEARRDVRLIIEKARLEWSLRR